MRRTLSLTLGILLACATIATASNNKKKKENTKEGYVFTELKTPSEHFGKITGQSRNLLVMVNRFFPRIRNHASR